MSVVDLLKEARDLISEESRWTKKAYARDSANQKVHSLSESACCWCSAGAVCRATARRWDDSDARRPTGTSRTQAIIMLNKAANDILPFSDLYGLNDYTDHATVLRMFDLAIEKASNAD